MPRKPSNGPVRSVDRTKFKLMEAVGTVLRRYGHSELKTSRIARAAKVDPKMIKHHFGSLDKLITTYIRSRDYWGNFPQNIIEDINSSDELKEETVAAIMEHQFDYFFSSPEMQKMVLWQLSTPSKVLRELTDGREVMAKELFVKADKVFDAAATLRFKAMTALFVGGIYSVILHTNGVGGTFCGLDFSKEKDRKLIKQEFAHLVKLFYANAGK